MNIDIKQRLIDKRGEFEDYYGDIIIWFQEEKALGGWQIIMLDKRNSYRRLERVLSSVQIEYVALDVIWHEFTDMRNELMK